MASKHMIIKHMAITHTKIKKVTTKHTATKKVTTTAITQCNRAHDEPAPAQTVKYTAIFNDSMKRTTWGMVLKATPIVILTPHPQTWECPCARDWLSFWFELIAFFNFGNFGLNRHFSHHRICWNEPHVYISYLTYPCPANEHHVSGMSASSLWEMGSQNKHVAICNVQHVLCLTDSE